MRSNRKIARAKNEKYLRGRRPSVKMALRVGGGTRRATFENQSEFFRKAPTVLEKKDRRGWRSPTQGNYLQEKETV